MKPLHVLWISALLIGPVHAADIETTKMNSDFWGDWKDLRQSDGWQKLQKSVGLQEQSQQAVTRGMKSRTQAVMNVTLDSPTRTASFLNGAAGASRSTENDGALATVLKTRASKTMVEAAESMVAPEVSARVVTFRANLSDGIPGLPGIYLGNNTGSGSVTTGNACCALKDVQTNSAPQGTSGSSANGSSDQGSDGTSQAGFGGSSASAAATPSSGGGAWGGGGSGGGIAGLPGVYLGDNAASNGANTSASVPAGFAPVGGGSMGCPTR